MSAPLVLVTWAKGSGLSTTVAFLAETQGSATIEEQKACLGADDNVIVAGRRGFHEIGQILARNGITLTSGDHVKVYDLTCLALSTTTLIRELTKLLGQGISFEIAKAGIVLKPGAKDKTLALLEAFDGHHRHVHGIKTHPVHAAPQGRKRILDPERLEAIRAMLDEPGATHGSVARELGVGRSTLFNYLERCKGDLGLDGGQKVVKRRSKHASDDGHVREGDA